MRKQDHVKGPSIFCTFLAFCFLTTFVIKSYVHGYFLVYTFAGPPAFEGHSQD